MELLFLAIGLIAGFFAAWFWARTKFENKSGLEPDEANKMKEENENLLIKTRVDDDKIKTFSAQANDFMNRIREKEKDIINLTSKLSAKTSDYEHLTEKLKEQKNEIENIREKFTTEFRNLANEILEEKTLKFTEQNRSNLDQILKPLGEKIKDFEKRVEETYVKESQQRFSLKEEVRRLAELNQQVSRETQNLTNALKGQAKTQGTWGELILENILEKSGLVKDREYFVQKSFTNPDGKRLQPDVIVTYPGNKSVVIDSKVSLTAYERFSSSESKPEQEKALKEHILSVRNHINELSSKNYQDIYDLNSLDFVMMFMPVEPSYMLAVQNDSGLWNYAYEKRIILISPTHLIAALKMVSSLWRQEYQSRNVLEIARQSGELYDKFTGLINDLLDVGHRLKATQKSYEASMNKLSTGRGNLVSRVEKIKKLGAKTSKELPQVLIERSENEN